MNRKSLLILTIALQGILASCNSQQKQPASTSNDTDSIAKDSCITIEKDLSFNDFLSKFSQDSVYQNENIKFPLKITAFGMDEEGSNDTTLYVKSQEWSFIDFRHGDKWPEPVTITAYKEGDGMALKAKGLDTGVLITYYFKKEGDQWKLEYIKDESN